MTDLAPDAGTGTTPTAPGRWFGVGSSTADQPIEAAREAVAAAVVGPDPALAVLFCSAQMDLAGLAAALHQLLPDVPLVGCSTAGEIASGQARECSLVLTVLGGAFDVSTRRAEAASTDLFGAGARAGQAVRDLGSRPHRVLLLLTDGLAGNQQEIVRGTYSEVGAAVPLVGGCAGDDSAMTKTYQFHGGELLEDSVVAAAIGSDSPFGIGVRHGWRPVGDPLMVSRSDATNVYELDGEPALDIYLRRSGHTQLSTDEASFQRHAALHPLGLRRREGEEVRFISGADRANRSLATIAEVPQGSLVWLMEGDQQSLLDGTAASCTAAIDALDGRDPLGLMLFDCIARRSVLGEEGLLHEMAAVDGTIPAVPVAGFYTYGEIARTQGPRGFHNQTLVTLAVS